METQEIKSVRAGLEVREEYVKVLIDDMDHITEKVAKLQATLPGVAADVESKLQKVMDEIALGIGLLQSETEKNLRQTQTALEAQGTHIGKSLSVQATELRYSMKDEASKAVASALNTGALMPVTEAINKIGTATKAFEKHVTAIEGTPEKITNAGTAAVNAVNTAVTNDLSLVKNKLEAMAAIIDKGVAAQNVTFWKRFAASAGLVIGTAVLTLVALKFLGFDFNNAKLDRMEQTQNQILRQLEEPKSKHK